MAFPRCGQLERESAARRTERCVVNSRRCNPGPLQRVASRSGGCYPGQMPIPVTCANPECGQPCVVPDNHAGRLVRCPRCPALIQVPLEWVAERVSAAVENFELDLAQFNFFGDAEAAPALPPPPPTQPPPPPILPPVPPSPVAGQDAFSSLLRFFEECRVTRAGTLLLGIALGCYVFLLIAILLPWHRVAYHQCWRGAVVPAHAGSGGVRRHGRGDAAPVPLRSGVVESGGVGISVRAVAGSRDRPGAPR